MQRQVVIYDVNKVNELLSMIDSTAVTGIGNMNLVTTVVSFLQNGDVRVIDDPSLDNVPAQQAENAAEEHEITDEEAEAFARGDGEEDDIFNSAEQSQE